MTASYTPPPKSGTATFLWNFFIPGAGHVYASGGERWGLLVFNIICGVLTPFIYVTLIGNVIIWIVAMATSGAVTDEYNGRVKQAAQSEANSRALDAQRVTGGEIARQLLKIHEMLTAGLVTATEAGPLRAEAISKCATGWTSEEMIEFLSPFATLVKSAAITDDELAQVKKAYALIRKVKPSVAA